MRSTLALLLLFGAIGGISATHTCKVYELPTADEGSCEITIKYNARDNKQALATCLEYFPTTFVKGEMIADGADKGKTKCIVTAAYQCVEPDTFLIFDKCYKFPKDPAGEYIKGTIKQYVDDKKCGNGKLSVFYSHTHAKFVGMKAHRENINKLWIGITQDGRTIERPNIMIHSKMWKLVEGDYWAGDVLTKIPPKGPDEKEQKIPAEAMYYFMRTRTDYVLNRIQGHFERASATVEATFACEFESVYTANQAWYCNKLPMLGIDAVYDDAPSQGTSNKPARCLFASANAYTFKGDSYQTAISDMKKIKGCQERPSALHSAGMDDGTGTPDKYTNLLKNKGKVRIAGHILQKTEMSQDSSFHDNFELTKCSSVKDENTKKHESLMQKWKYLTHHGKAQYPATSQIPWNSDFPKNECTDLPGYSSSIGIKNGQQIDMPPEVPAPAVCSLMFFQECENSETPLCAGNLACKNKDSFQTNTGSTVKQSGFFTCECPGADKPAKNDNPQPYTEKIVSGVKTCEWTGKADTCAWLGFFEVPSGTKPDRYQKNGELVWLWVGSDALQEDRLDRLIVREGCSVTVLSHQPNDHRGQFTLTTVGKSDPRDHHVPNGFDKTLVGQWTGLGASIVNACVC